MIGLDRFLPDSACIKQDSTNIPRTTLIPFALKTVVIPQGDHTWAKLSEFLYSTWWARTTSMSSSMPSPGPEGGTM